METVKQHKGYLVYFMECISRPKHYIIRKGREREMESMYLKFNRLEQYHPSTFSEEERMNGLDYGYPKVDVRRPISIEIGREEDAEKFKCYLWEKFEDSFVDETDIERNRGFKFKGDVGGWYFIEKLESEKWLAEFYEHQNQRRQEFLKASTNGMQTALF